MASWSEALQPVPMARVAVVAPRGRLRAALVRVADAGVVELDRLTRPGDLPPGEAARRLQRLHAATSTPALLATAAPDLDELERHGRHDLLAGEAQLEEYQAESVRRGAVSALAGWTPTSGLPELRRRLAPVGAAVVVLPRPAGSTPPTVLRRAGMGSSFSPVVETYATVPYADVDPTPFAGLAYVVMFGMMFGDVGHGLLLLLAALTLRAGWPRRLVARWSALRRGWPFLAGAGLSSMAFGLAYGEAFGPTGLVPELWLAPLEEPVRLLLAGIALGAVLLAVAYAIGTVNRVREGGWALALYAPSGLAGSTLFLGLGLVTGGALADQGILFWLGVLVAAVGLVLSFVGLHAAAGGGAAGVAQTIVELFDVVVRLGANVVSFARLAAFGLTHAALGAVIWQATTGLWDRGPAGMLAAAVVFLAGNVVAFALEALVAGVQALRLEYYELFSRVFQVEGRGFHPWHVPMATEEGA